MAEEWLASVRSLVEGPSPAVLTTYRREGSVHVSPVWFRWNDGAFEVLIAEGDLKLAHLRRDRRCVLVVFEATAPFGGTVSEERFQTSSQLTEDETAWRREKR